ncbi:MAG: hypothetical protein ACRC4N_09485 [Gammaproteobacteria bacterium]
MFTCPNTQSEKDTVKQKTFRRNAEHLEICISSAELIAGVSLSLSLSLTHTLYWNVM